MKRILDKRKFNSADWQEYRQNEKRIGGSDVATILNLNPYKSAFVLWLEKTGQIQPKPVENEYVEWGNILEPIIRDKFKRETGFKVFQNNFVLQHETHEFMIANVDGEVIDPAFGGKRGVLEIKTASERMKNNWENGCPNNYMLQIQHYLACLNYEYAYVAVLIGGNHFKYYLIHRDEYIIDTIISAEMNFMNMVKNMIPPEIGGTESESQWLASAFPEAIDQEKYLSADLEEMAGEYGRLQGLIKELQSEADQIKNQLKLEAKENKFLVGNELKITLPTIKKVTFDSKRFAGDHPDLYKQYKTKESSYRGFTISMIKGG